jgi:hypothetical protein
MDSLLLQPESRFINFWTYNNCYSNHVLWHVVPLLGNDSEINNYTTAITRQRHVNINIETVLSVRSVILAFLKQLRINKILSLFLFWANSIHFIYSKVILSPCTLIWSLCLPFSVWNSFVPWCLQSELCMSLLGSLKALGMWRRREATKTLSYINDKLVFMWQAA